MRERREVNTIDLVELAMVVLQRWYIVAASGIACAIIAFLYTWLTVTPMYSSTTSIYILTKQNPDIVTSNDLYISTMLAEDSANLIKSRGVMQAVSDEMQLGLRPEAVAGMVNVSSTSDSSRIIKITVTYPDPAMAQKIADCVREVASRKFIETMDLQAVNVVDEADLPVAPSNNVKKKNTMMGFMLGIILSAGVFIVIYLLNTNIRTEEDIEKYLGISVLGVIPDSDAGRNTEELVMAERNGEDISGTRRRRKRRR